MCYRPLKIKNPKIMSTHSDLDASIDKFYISVPCGKCGECRTYKQDAIYLRTNAEYDVTLPFIENGNGFVFFNTFTYDENNVPFFKGMRCFDSEHFQLFKKRLRIHMYREYDIEPGCISFLWVSEYGSNTARPHYHCLFFIRTNKITLQQFGELCERDWWYGYTQTNNPYDLDYYHNYDSCLVQDRSGCIKYVAKYCTKDYDFLYILNRQRPQEFIDYLSESLPSDMSLDDIDYSTLYKCLPRSIYNKILPYNRFSHHFGESLINLPLDELMQGFHCLPDKEKGTKSYKIPQYIERKVFYTYDKTTRLYTLNKLGEQMRVERCKLNTDYVSKSTSDIIFNWYTYLDLGRRSEIVSLVNRSCDYNVETVDDVSDLFVDLMDGRSMTDYANYIILYKDFLRPVDGDVYTSLGHQGYIVVQDNYNKHRRFIDKRTCDNLLRDMSNFCNSMYEFRNFDLVYKLYDLIRCQLGKYRQNDYIFNMRQSSKVKFGKILSYGKY